MLRDPSGELPVPHVAAGIGFFLIGRIDDDESFRGVEKILHVFLKNRVFDKMKNDIQRKTEIGFLTAPGEHGLEGVVRVDMKRL